MKTTGLFIVKQPIVIQVEVATPRWFAKGVQVTPPAFNDIVFLPITGSAIIGSTATGSTSLVSIRVQSFSMAAVKLIISFSNIFKLPFNL
jgi:hypothetical protein